MNVTLIIRVFTKILDKDHTLG